MKAYYNDHVFYRGLLHEHITIERGEGVYIYDTEGNRYLDASGQRVGGIISIGYGVGEVAEAMAAQARKITFLYGGSFSSQAFVEFADRVVEMAPEGLNRVWLVSSGSEAVESALKLVRQYHLGKGNGSKYRFIARWLSFHGVTTGALSMTGLPVFREGYEPLLLNFPHIAPCYCYRCPFGGTYPQCGVACADDLEREILQSGPETIAAFIAEPITMSAIVGHVPPPEYFPRIREICNKYDVLFVADCVQTGFGWTGSDFAISQWGVTPDIIVFAKGISGGYFPLGGMIVSDKIIDVLVEKFQGDFRHGQTYTGNPLAAAVGVKVLEIIRRDGLVSRAKERGEYLLRRLRDLYDRHPIIGEVRGRGLMVGAEFVKDRETKEPFPQEIDFPQRLVKAAQDRGVLIWVVAGNVAIGAGGDQLRLTPPLIISEQELDMVIEAIDQALTEVEEEVL
jgi:adenosylmethionine-8-amino-7-oxononanoate aminotransferase